MLHKSQMTQMSQMSFMGVLGWWVCMGVHGCEWVRLAGWVWDEFSEYLLETRFLTSPNYNTHPLQIFLILVVIVS